MGLKLLPGRLGPRETALWKNETGFWANRRLLGSYRPTRLAHGPLERTVGQREAEAATEDGVCCRVVVRLSCTLRCCWEKLIRMGEAGREEPGVLLGDGTRVDVSGFA